MLNTTRNGIEVPDPGQTIYPVITHRILMKPEQATARVSADDNVSPDRARDFTLDSLQDLSISGIGVRGGW